MTEEQQIMNAFLSAIKEDRYDQNTRLTFADWLEEQGFDDEALIQREWTREKQEAEDWLREFAGQLGEDCVNYGYEQPCDKWEPITYEQIIQAGYDARNYGDYFVQRGSEKARGVMWINQETFWKNWQIVTGETIDDETKQHTVFSCTC